MTTRLRAIAQSRVGKGAHAERVISADCRAPLPTLPQSAADRVGKVAQGRRTASSAVAGDFAHPTRRLRAIAQSRVGKGAHAERVIGADCRAPLPTLPQSAADRVGKVAQGRRTASPAVAGDFATLRGGCALSRKVGSFSVAEVS